MAGNRGSGRRRNNRRRRTTNVQSAITRLKTGVVKGNRRISADPPSRSLMPVRTYTVKWIIANGALFQITRGDQTTPGVITTPSGGVVPINAVTVANGLTSQLFGYTGAIAQNTIMLNLRSVKVWAPDYSTGVNMAINSAANFAYPVTIVTDVAGKNKKAHAALSTPSSCWVDGFATTVQLARFTIMAGQEDSSSFNARGELHVVVDYKLIGPLGSTASETANPAPTNVLVED